MKLSIITINLNNVEGLRKTVESVVSQTFIDFEYIVIDGDSTDGSVDIIKQYADKITYWVSEPDTGIYNAMNKGIAAATGEYTLFLNSGDYLYANDILETLFTEFFTEDIVVYSLLKELVDKNEFVVYTIGLTQKITNSFMFNIFKHFLPHQSILIKRELFNKIGRYDESYKIAADYDFFVKAVKKKSTSRINPLVLSVFNDQGISNTNQSLSLAEYFKIKRKHFPIRTIVLDRFVYKILIKIKWILKKIANANIIKRILKKIANTNIVKRVLKKISKNKTIKQFINLMKDKLNL